MADSKSPKLDALRAMRERGALWEGKRFRNDLSDELVTRGMPPGAPTPKPAKKRRKHK